MIVFESGDKVYMKTDDIEGFGVVVECDASGAEAIVELCGQPFPQWQVHTQFLRLIEK